MAIDEEGQVEQPLGNRAQRLHLAEVIGRDHPTHASLTISY